MSVVITVGKATDALYVLAQQAVAGVTVNGTPAVAADGPVDNPVFGMFVVGQELPGPDESGDTAGAGLVLSTLGMSNQLAEDYVIPCYIDVRLAATRSNGVTQKTARDLAESIFNPFLTGLCADPSLGLGAAFKAELTQVTFTPQSVGTAAEPGRRQFASFAVRCTNLINPN